MRCNSYQEKCQSLGRCECTTKVCQLMERYDGHGRDVKVLVEV